MFVVIEHEIHNASQFQQCADQLFPLPEGLTFHQFFPANDMSRAACLYETDSLEKLQDHLDGLLGGASSQRYFPVAETQAVGLPARQMV